ncbi:hypothetical protein M422DRAFT_81424, partial [Sphaerobolus stellatus SS14]
KSRIFLLHADIRFPMALVQHGYIPTSPLQPTRAFSIAALEMFHALARRAPQLSLQKFAWGLCDMQGVTFPPHLRNHLSNAYDVYLEIRRRVSKRLDAKLGRDAPHWHLANACVACTYVLEDELELKYDALVTLDGNNSLKRMERTQREKDEQGHVTFSQNIERADDRTTDAYFNVNSEDVDKFKDEVKRPSLIIMDSGADPVDGCDEPTPCIDRWKNLSDEALKKMWGVFLETGVFTALCRHGTLLLLCDMIRSGELAKYPLSLIDRLMTEFRPRLLIGYDIGCGFSVTANRSALLGPKLQESGSRFCVGVFHGHAHCRTCQLDWHPLHVEGAGLEAFEGNENAYSESNAVAGITRHASRFHRQQAIVRHFERWNMDKYTELSRFLYNNYKQALEILATEEILHETMRNLKIPSVNTFHEWREEEKKYLLSLKTEPEEDVLKFEYLKTLQQLRSAYERWLNTPIEELRHRDFYTRDESLTRSLETSRIRGLDSLLTLQCVVADLEEKLDIAQRWTPESDEWKETAKKLAMREYQHAVDRVEGLVVSRLFELTKINQSGVKMRMHIAKALKSRSQAIRNTVGDYNVAAAALSPPRPSLEVSQVLQYVFIAEFDILRDSRNDVRTKPWAQSAEREASTAYFKILRAKEEIQRLNVEVRRLLTYILEEEALLSSNVTDIAKEDPALAHQLAKQLKHFKALNGTHLQRIIQLLRMEGYTGHTTAGVRKGTMDEDMDSL